MSRAGGQRELEIPEEVKAGFLNDCSMLSGISFSIKKELYINLIWDM